MKYLRSVLAGLAVGLPVGALAQAATNAEPANYLGVTLGTGKVGLHCPPNTSCSPVQTSGALRLGHRFDPNWAVELGYTDIAADFSFLQRYSASVKSYSLGAALTLPLSNSFSAQLRAGAASHRLRFQPPFSPGDVLPFSVSKTSVKPYVGLGASWQFARRWSAHVDADWSRADLRVGGSNNPDQTVSVRFYGAGVAFHF